MKTTGTTTRALYIAGRLVPRGVAASQILLTGIGPAMYSVTVPGYGRRFVAVSAVR